MKLKLKTRVILEVIKTDQKQPKTPHTLLTASNSVSASVCDFVWACALIEA